MDYSQPVVSKILLWVTMWIYKWSAPLDVLTLENILWCYLAHLGRMRRTTTTTVNSYLKSGCSRNVLTGSSLC